MGASSPESTFSTAATVPARATCWGPVRVGAGGWWVLGDGGHHGDQDRHGGRHQWGSTVTFGLDPPTDVPVRTALPGHVDGVTGIVEPSVARDQQRLQPFAGEQRFGPSGRGGDNRGVEVNLGRDHPGPVLRPPQLRRQAERRPGARDGLTADSAGSVARTDRTGVIVRV